MVQGRRRPPASLPVRPSRNGNQKGGCEAAFFMPARRADRPFGASGPLRASLVFDRPQDQRNRKASISTVPDPPRIRRFSSAVEQRFCKPKVGSSILSTGTRNFFFSYFRILRIRRPPELRVGYPQDIRAAAAPKTGDFSVPPSPSLLLKIASSSGAGRAGEAFQCQVILAGAASARRIADGNR